MAVSSSVGTKAQSFLFCGSATPCASPPSRPSIFSNYSFWVHHPANRDDRHLLAHAMVSDFLVAWQFLSKRTIGFSLCIKLHAKFPFFKKLALAYYILGAAVGVPVPSGKAKLTTSSFVTQPNCVVRVYNRPPEIPKTFGLWTDSTKTREWLRRFESQPRSAM
jgi:hypothetical protein